MESKEDKSKNSMSEKNMGWGDCKNFRKIKNRIERSKRISKRQDKLEKYVK